jgi:hypothetical protein
VFPIPTRQLLKVIACLWNCALVIGMAEALQSALETKLLVYQTDNSDLFYRIM